MNEIPDIDVADLRKRMGLSRAEFAERLQVTREYVRQMEEYGRRPGKHLTIYMQALAHALDTSP